MGEVLRLRIDQIETPIGELLLVADEAGRLREACCANRSTGRSASGGARERRESDWDRRALSSGDRSERITHRVWRRSGTQALVT